MKKNVAINHTKITNDLMHYIYYNIDSQINLDTLSRDFKISKFHLHRIFKQEFGSNIYQTIKSIRLQKASNLLISNKNSTISEISALCGYSSQTSFIRAFIARFGMSPKKWRKGGFIEYSNQIVGELKTSQVSYSGLTPVIKKMAALDVFYIRHHGYDEGIRRCWQKLQTLTLMCDIKEYKQIAIYHDNPIVTPLKECNYVACIATEEEFTCKDNNLPSFESDAGVYAEFSAEGYDEDMLKLIQWIYHEWLPSSGFETTTQPPFLIYEENNYLNQSGYFKLKYYIPIVLA